MFNKDLNVCDINNILFETICPYLVLSYQNIFKYYTVQIRFNVGECTLVLMQVTLASKLPWTVKRKWWLC